MNLPGPPVKGFERVGRELVPVAIGRELQHLSHLQREKGIVSSRVRDHLLIHVEDKDPVEREVSRFENAKDLEAPEGSPFKGRVTGHEIFPEECEVTSSLGKNKILHQRFRDGVEGLDEGL